MHLIVKITYRKRSKKKMSVELINGDCVGIIGDMISNGETVDAIVTDPPYQYLNHKMDKAFREELFFQRVYDLLKENGFLVFFGRGSSFYRWNVICEKIGFKFKEELIWDKKSISNPAGAIGRCHETIAVHGKGNAKLKRVFVDYFEHREANEHYENYKYDLNRIRTLFRNNNFDEIKERLEKKTPEKKVGHRVTLAKKWGWDRGAETLKRLDRGLLLRSIVRENREHYKTKHPTQKPYKLIEKLISLTTNEGDTVLDPFMGSGSTGIACRNLKRNFIGIDIDDNYVKVAKERIK
jgi:site-specific DNA-methyltransferase (adenine-specific)